MMRSRAVLKFCQPKDFPGFWHRHKSGSRDLLDFLPFLLFRQNPRIGDFDFFDSAIFDFLTFEFRSLPTPGANASCKKFCGTLENTDYGFFFFRFCRRGNCALSRFTSDSRTNFR
jgi:hypothetical protein